jgi:hypothetical protein
MGNDNVVVRTEAGPQEVAASKLIDEGAQAVAIAVVNADGSVQIAYMISDRALPSYAGPALLCGVDNLY